MKELGMSNWVQNRLEIRCVDANQKALVRQLLLDGDKQLTFNTVVPMPYILTRIVEPVQCGGSGRMLLRDPEQSDAWLEATKTEQRLIDTLPCQTASTWRAMMWGTDHDARHVEVEETHHGWVYRFKTRDDAPRAWYDGLTDWFNVEFPYQGVTFRATAQYQIEGSDYEDVIVDTLPDETGPQPDSDSVLQELEAQADADVRIDTRVVESEVQGWDDIGLRGGDLGASI
jgi:hypothetical protein